MEEARNYMLTIISILIGVLTVYSSLRLTSDFSRQTQRTRAVRSSLVVLVISAGLGGMHLLGRRGLTGFTTEGRSLLISLFLYMLTLAGILYLFLRMRMILGEREQLKELAYRDTLTGLLEQERNGSFLGSLQNERAACGIISGPEPVQID